jgi:hypothetical protein
LHRDLPESSAHARTHLSAPEERHAVRQGPDCRLAPRIRPAEAKRPDPLMGWAGSGDTQQQVVLKFASEADALAYAEKYGIEVHVTPSPVHRLKIQSYADNFR